MSKFYFFTNPDKLGDQSAEDAFGPLTASGAGGTDQYRVCSRHCVEEGAQAVAVCDGIVMVRPSESDSLVNVVLFPTQQPSVGFQKITCYVYRGIKKESLFEDDGGTLVIKNKTNMLTASILKTQAKRIAKINKKNEDLSDGEKLEVPPEFPNAKVLGMELDFNISNITITDTYNLFTSSDEQPYLIKGGMTLGDFDNTAGFEIIAERMVQETPASVLDCDDNIVAVPQMPVSSDKDAFINLHERHAILNYIDPAAFFGMFYQKGLRGYNSTADAVNYTSELLPVLLNKFVNAHVIYLDIRNNQDLYFNYYRSNDDEIKLSFDSEGTSVSWNYLGEAGGKKWPLWRLTADMFTGNHDSDVAKLYLELPLKGYAEPTVSVKQGYIPNKGKGNTLSTVGNSGKVLYLSVNEAEQAYAKSFIIQLPLNNKELVASQFRLTYLDSSVVFNDERIEGDLIPEINHRYDVAFPFSVLEVPHVTTMGDVATKVFYDELFVDASFDKNWVYTAMRGITKGLDGVTGNSTYILWTFPIKSHTVQAFSPLSTFSPLSNILSNTVNPFQGILGRNVIARENSATFTNSGVVETFEYTSLSVEKVSSNPFQYCDPTNLEYLTFSQGDWDTITEKLTSSGFETSSPVYLGLKLLRSVMVDEGFILREYSIVLQGITEDETSKLVQTVVDTEIKKIIL